MSDSPEPRAALSANRKGIAAVSASPELSIIIPAYNEEARIGYTLDSAAEVIAAHLPDTEVIVVDDGSTDGTVALVEERRAQFPCALHVLSEPHRGKGAAVRTGMLAGKGRRRMYCDADLAMPFSEIARFLGAADAGADIVIGSRQVAGAIRRNESWARHTLGRGFNLLVRALAVQGIADTQCGYKLFGEEAARQIFRRLTIDGFAFDVEALFIARVLGFTIAEIPIVWRAVPISKVHPMRHALEMLVQLFRIRLRGMRGAYER